MTIYYDDQLPINYVISKAVLLLVHRKHMLKYADNKLLTFKLLFLLFVIKIENNDKKFHRKALQHAATKFFFHIRTYK